MTGEKHFTVQNLSSCVLIVWGIFTVNPYDESFVRNPKLYAAMLFLVSSQLFWGAFFLVCGIVGIYLNYHQKLKTALFLGIIYLFFTSLFFFGDYNSRAWAYYGLFALWNLNHWRGLKRRGND